MRRRAGAPGARPAAFSRPLASAPCAAGLVGRLLTCTTSCKARTRRRWAGRRTWSQNTRASPEMCVAIIHHRARSSSSEQRRSRRGGTSSSPWQVPSDRCRSRQCDQPHSHNPLSTNSSHKQAATLCRQSGAAGEARTFQQCLYLTLDTKHTPHGSFFTGSDQFATAFNERYTLAEKQFSQFYHRNFSVSVSVV